MLGDATACQMCERIRPLPNWTCPKCTLSNSHTLWTCAACEACRLPATVPSKQTLASCYTFFLFTQQNSRGLKTFINNLRNFLSDNPKSLDGQEVKVVLVSMDHTCQNAVKCQKLCPEDWYGVPHHASDVREALVKRVQVNRTDLPVLAVMGADGRVLNRDVSARVTATGMRANTFWRYVFQ